MNVETIIDINKSFSKVSEFSVIETDLLGNIGGDNIIYKFQKCFEFCVIILDNQLQLVLIIDKERLDDSWILLIFVTINELINDCISIDNLYKQSRGIVGIGDDIRKRVKYLYRDKCRWLSDHVLRQGSDESGFGFKYIISEVHDSDSINKIRVNIYIEGGIGLVIAIV